MKRYIKCSKGTADDMLAAFKAALGRATMQEDVESSEDIEAFESIDSTAAIEFLVDHDMAYDDALRFFKTDDLSKVPAAELESWIYDHDQLGEDFDDFCARHEDVESCNAITGNEAIMATDNPVYLDVDGMMGEPNDIWDEASMIEYFENNHDSDPSLGAYENMQDWLRETEDSMKDITDDLESIANDAAPSEVVNMVMETFKVSKDVAENVAQNLLGVPVMNSCKVCADDEATSYELIDSKDVQDADGFMTVYTMYKDNDLNRFVFVFGDPDLYSPEDGEFDYECESEEEAREWFCNYSGFDTEE